MSVVAYQGDNRPLTPELLDLMEHEKVIDQGLAGFLEVGHALIAIRDGKKYRAARNIDGSPRWSTFADYCQDRWQMTPHRGRQLMRSAEVVEEMVTTVTISPQAERQVRPLTALPNPEDRQAAWDEAVEEAGGQPTAAQVQKAVDKRKPPNRDHPAPFSGKILDAVADQLKEAGTPETVLDPFAGTGRVHELRERAGVVTTIGVELEPEWADKHPDTIQGNALQLTEQFEPDSVDAIVTSPTYGNRMADHHDAKDDSTRLTYKHTLGRDLNEDNSGQMQWGDEYRDFHRKAWAESVTVLKPGGIFTLNVKNHIRAGEVQRVTEWHINTLMHDFGLHLVAIDIIPGRGLAAGANTDQRTAFELVITLRKPG